MAGPGECRLPVSPACPAKASWRRRIPLFSFFILPSPFPLIPLFCETNPFPRGHPEGIVLRESAVPLRICFWATLRFLFPVVQLRHAKCADRFVCCGRAGILPAGYNGFQPFAFIFLPISGGTSGKDARKTGRQDACPTCPISFCIHLINSVTRINANLRELTFNVAQSCAKLRLALR